MRTILAIDMDDVLKEFNRALFAFYNALYGTNHTLDEATCYSLEKCWKCSTEKAYEALNLFYASEEHHDTPPVEGAIDAIKSLKEQHDLHIVTARPSILEEVTMKWINRHFPEMFRAVHFATTCPSGANDGTGIYRPKSEICIGIGATALIEDNLSYAVTAAQSGITTYLINRPWNQAADLPPNIIRVHSWREILTHLA